MGSTPQQPSPRPTLEELLRFKRAERPAPEFWAEFDRGLRQKQLAALVKRPQGWARVRPTFARSLKWIAPATAAIAVALVVVQMPLSTASRNTPVNVASLPVRPTQAAAMPVAVASAQPVVSVSQIAAPVATEAPIVARAEPAEVAPLVVAAAPHAERILPWSAVAGESMRNASGVDTFVSLPVSREVRRPRSSWTSRYNEMAQEISAEQSADRVLQLASCSLPAASDNVSVVARADSAPASYATSLRSGRAIRDRDFRDMESRMGSASGSGLAIRF
jgi:hypothetical protein